MIKFKDLNKTIQETAEKMMGNDLNELKLYVDNTVHSGVQPWGKILADLEQQKTKDPETEAREMYASALGIVTTVEKKLSRLLKKVAPKDSKILIDIKKEDAFVDKIINRGKKGEKITDVLRSAVLVETQDDLDKLVRNVEKAATIYEHEVKREGEDKEFGYHGSHHFLVVIDDVLIEVQAMTKRLWAFKMPAHDIYAKWRSAKEFDDRIVNKEKQQSRILFKKGNKNVFELEAGERQARYKEARQGKFAQKIKFTN